MLADMVGVVLLSITWFQGDVQLTEPMNLGTFDTVDACKYEATEFLTYLQLEDITMKVIEGVPGADRFKLACTTQATEV